MTRFGISFQDQCFSIHENERMLEALNQQRKKIQRPKKQTQWAQDVHRTSPGRLLVPVYFRRPEDVKMGPDLNFILRDVLRTSLGRPIKKFN